MIGRARALRGVVADVERGRRAAFADVIARHVIVGAQDFFRLVIKANIVASLTPRSDSLRKILEWLSRDSSFARALPPIDDAAAK